MLDPRTPYICRIVDDYGEGIDSAINAQINEDGLLCYQNLIRGHMLNGKVKKELPNGIVFETENLGTFTLTPITMEQFDRYERPSLDDYESGKLQTLDDVYFWYRRQVGIV